MSPDRPVRRSSLMMPIVTERFVDKAWERGCDAIALDLEDSVPQNLKDRARGLFKDKAPLVARGGAEVFVRINHEFMEDDIEAVIWPPLVRVIYPKAEHASEIQALDELMTRLETERGIEPGSIEINPLIESALAVSNAMEIASASPRIQSFGCGGGYDLSQDLGVEMFVPFDQFFYQRGETELIARALDLEPSGGIFMANPSGSVSDPDYAFRSSEAARKAGFRTAGGLHPAIVEPQNRGYTPTEDEVTRAHWVLEQYRAIAAIEETWREVDGVVIDRYEARRAEELIDWATRCAARDMEKADAVAATRAALES